MVRFTPAGFELTDQGSSSGTYVNNRRVNQQLLIDGDEIHCGSFTLKFLIDDGPRGAQIAPSVQLRGKLTFQDDANEDCQVYLNPQSPQILVGRSTECQIRTADGSVSRRHSEFTFNQSTFEVRDLGSFNGTYVNGVKVTHQRIQHGDEINCGRLTILFTQEEHRGLPSSASSTALPRFNEPQDVGETILPLSGNPFSGPFSGPISALKPDQPPTLAASNLRPPFAADPGPGTGQIAPQSPTLAPSAEQASRIDLKISALEETIESLTAENDALRRELDEARSRTEDRARDLEKSLNQKQVVIDSFQERYDQLKLQAEDQLKQLEAYRDELRLKREVIEDQQYKLNLIEQAQDRGNNQVVVLIEENANLKVQINQLERQIAELDRGANLHEFELKRVQSELENLREMVSDEGSENADLQNEINRLRLVLDAKEASLNDAERDLDRLRSEVSAYREGSDQNVDDLDRLTRDLEAARRQLDLLTRDNAALRQQSASGAGLNSDEARGLQADNARLLRDLEAARAELQMANSGYGGASSAQLNDLKRTNRDQRNRIDELEALVEELERNTATTHVPAHDPEGDPRLRAERDAMQRRIEGLEADLRNAVRAQSGDLAIQELKTGNQRLEAELDQLRQQLREASRAGTSRPGALSDEAASTYELLNDVVSQLKNDMQLIQDYVTDLRDVYETFRRIDPQTLPTLDRIRVEKTLREMKPEVTFEELSHVLGECSGNTEDMKSKLMDFKEKLIR